jgi:hypothetical protein
MKKINIDDLKLVEDEKIIKIYYPRALLESIFYILDKRTSLIITDRRIILRRIFKSFDREINFEDISDVLKGFSFITGSLDILKKGEAPIDNSYYSPHFSFEWLSISNLNEIFETMKEKTNKK